jgi:hypothetical protein
MVVDIVIGEGIMLNIEPGQLVAPSQNRWGKVFDHDVIEGVMMVKPQRADVGIIVSIAKLSAPGIFWGFLLSPRTMGWIRLTDWNHLM